MFSEGLFFPALALCLIAWVIPKLISMVLPEGIKPLLLNAFLSTIILFVICTGFFVVLYVNGGVPLSELLQFGWLSNVSFFGRLGLIAGLMWAPVMFLSVASLPRTWTKEVW